MTPAQPHHTAPEQAHVHDAGADRRALTLALAVIAAFMVVEVVAALVAHSLALLGDAAHMLTDVGALGLSIVTLRLAQRPPAGGLTFGLRRAEVLSALVNGATLFLLGGALVVEAVRRLYDPPAVAGGVVLVIALAGIGVNLLAAGRLHHAQSHSINVRGSVQHILTDLYAFCGTAVAGLVMLTTGFQRADPLATLVVAALMLRAATGLLRDAGHILLEAAPSGTDPARVGQAMADHAHVANVHDLHVWQVTSGFPALSAHVIVHPGDDCHQISIDLKTMLAERFGIEHTTLQVDHERVDRPVTVRPLARP